MRFLDLLNGTPTLPTNDMEQKNETFDKILLQVFTQDEVNNNIIPFNRVEKVAKLYAAKVLDIALDDLRNRNDQRINELKGSLKSLHELHKEIRKLNNT